MYRPLFITLAGGIFLLAGCSAGSISLARLRPTVNALPSATKTATLPGLAQASRMKPCDAVSITELSSIIGKPVQISIGKVSRENAQKPQLSSGPVLPEVWIATCNWSVPAYPSTTLYLQMELAPTAQGALTDFDALVSGMQLKAPDTHEAGFGNDSVFDDDGRGNVTILIRQGAEIINLQFNTTSQPAPHAADKLRMAKAIARLVVLRRRI